MVLVSRAKKSAREPDSAAGVNDDMTDERGEADGVGADSCDAPEEIMASDYTGG